MKKLFFSLFFLSFAALSLFAQSPFAPELTQNSPSLKWRQMNSEHFQLIFEASYEKQAPAVMQALEATYLANTHGIKVLPKKIPIIMQTQNIQSNGFVDAVNFRSEFFLTPAQHGFGSTGWMQTLAVHEGRHIVQMAKEKQQGAQFFHAILGDAGSYIPFFNIPQWFFEGDATGQETALTQSGRGRTPEFDVLLRQRLLTSKPYSYATSFNDSYKANVPNHYVNGYYLTSYMKNNYGVDVFDKILERTYKFKSSFRQSTKKVTGKSIPEIYDLTMAEAREKWAQQVAKIEETNATLLNHRKTDVFTNYSYPQILPDGRILARRRGMGDIGQFVILDKNSQENEKVIHTIGPFDDGNTLSTVNNKLVWSEYSFDPRYEQREYSTIKIMDINTGDVRNVVSKTKYHAPAFSPDGNQIVVSEIAPTGINTLVIIDTETGKEIKRLSNPENKLLTQPKYMPDGKSIIAISQHNCAMAIVAQDVKTGNQTELFNVGTEFINNPMAIGDYIFYNSTHSGIDNIYAFDPKTSKHYQVTSRKYGAYSLSGNTKELCFNDFQKEGYQVATMPYAPKNWKEIDFAENKGDKVLFVEKYAKQEISTDIFGKMPEKAYPVTDFKSLKNGLKVYGWGVGIQGTGLDIAAPKIGIGVTDLLHTVLAKAAVGYHLNERAIAYSTSLNYEKYYPKLSLTYENTYRKGAGFDAAKKAVTDNYNVQTVEAGVKIPLNLTRSKYNQSLSMAAYASQNIVSGFNLPNIESTELPNGTFQAMRYAVNYSSTLRTSYLDIAPKAGISVGLSFQHTPFNTTIKAQQLALNTSLFLPGIGKHHAVLLRHAFQSEDVTNYRFSNVIVQPRGSKNLFSKQFNIFTFEYKMPLVAPDLNFGTRGNLKRINTAIWTDYALLSGDKKQHTVGIDLSFDIGLFSLPVPISLGARSYYDVELKKFGVQPLLFSFGF
jgi:WD40 repeat protein